MQNLTDHGSDVNLADCRLVAPVASRLPSRTDRQRALQNALLTAEIQLYELSKTATSRQSKLIRDALLPTVDTLRRACHRAEILPLLPSEGRR